MYHLAKVIQRSLLAWIGVGERIWTITHHKSHLINENHDDLVTILHSNFVCAITPHVRSQCRNENRTKKWIRIHYIHHYIFYQSNNQFLFVYTSRVCSKCVSIPVAPAVSSIFPEKYLRYKEWIL